MSLYGQELLYSDPLFTHQYSHAWIDFRGVRDKFMRERDNDYFENSRRATIVQREYALANPGGYKGYGENCWGFSAGEGPGKRALTVDGVHRRFLGYAARGVPFGPEDGTIAASSAVSSLPFAPELAIGVLRHLTANSLGVTRHGRLTSGFNLTFPGADLAEWVSSGSFGLDQGIPVLFAESAPVMFRAPPPRFRVHRQSATTRRFTLLTDQDASPGYYSAAVRSAAPQRSTQCG